MKFFLLIVFIFMNILSAKNCEYLITKNSDFKKLNFENCKTILVDIKSGTYDLKHPILLNLLKTDGVLIRGEGIKNTKILVKNKQGAIKIKLKQKNTVVKIKYLSIYSSQKDIATAISISQPNGGNQHRRNVIIKDIEIANFKNKSKFFFKQAIVLKGVWRPLLDNVFISGLYGPKSKGTVPKMQSCFQLEEVYSPTITNSRCWSSQYGINMISKRDPGPEGIMIDRSKFVETVIGINIDYISQEPGGFIINNHINATNKGINIKNRKFVIINNNLMYQNKESKEYKDIDFDNVDNSIISNNIFHYPSKNKLNHRKEIYLRKSTNNIISNNIFTKKTKKVFGTIDKNRIINNLIP